MVEKFESILQKILQEKKEITFFGIMKMEELSDKWSVIISASWAKAEDRATIFEYIKKLLDETFTLEERSNIAKIGIFDKDEPLIQYFLQLNGAKMWLKDSTINGIRIREAYILASNR